MEQRNGPIDCYPDRSPTMSPNYDYGDQGTNSGPNGQTESSPRAVECMSRPPSRGTPGPALPGRTGRVQDGSPGAPHLTSPPYSKTRRLPVETPVADRSQGPGTHSHNSTALETSRRREAFRHRYSALDRTWRAWRCRSGVASSVLPNWRFVY